MVDYRSWLTQTQARPYLNTINDAGTGREDYDETTLVERSPALKAYQSFSFIPLANPMPAAICFLRCEMTYEFRGRRLNNESIVPPA